MKRFLLLVGAGIVLDQLTKQWAEASLRGRGIVQVVDGYFDLRLSHNRGAFFSLGQSMPDSIRVAFFLVMATIAIVFMVRLYRRTPGRQRALRWALTLLCSGAIGNMIDRALRGTVTDFLHLHVREAFHWATFNVADIWIAAGLVLLAVDLWQTRKVSAT